MRKLIFIFLSLSICHAQSFEISAFGGGGISNIWGVRFPLQNTSVSFGANAGINLSYNIDDINTVRLEAQYDSKPINSTSDIRNRHYIVISPMMQFYFSQKVRLYFLIGHFTGILANKTNADNPYDMGMIVGIGYKQNIWRKKLNVFLEVKEYLGFMNTMETGYANTNKLNASFGIGYKF